MNYLLLILPGCLLAGLSVYSILSYLLVPVTITLPLSFIISILTFGLTKYYLSDEKRKEETEKSLNKSHESTMANITFVVIFVVVLVIITFFPSGKFVELFVSWEHTSPIQVIKIAAAIAFCFFLPGYALVMILDKERKLTMLLRLLLAYTSSMLFAGVAGYIGASFGFEMSERRILIIFPSILLLILFVVQRFMTSSIDIRHISPAFYYNALCRIWQKTREKNSQLIIFASLFALVILYTYYLNNGEIVVDQWFYHGRALLMSSPAYKDLSTAETYKDPYETKVSDINEVNPPFFSALLSAFFNLSGSPSVNAYTSINFLNIMPVLAFYYFFTSWVHKDNRRAVMLAVTLFMLSSGFGWIYVLYSTSTSAHITSAPSSIDVLSRAADRTYDIGLPTTFINVGHPDVTTPFIITALPAGLTLLGLVGQIKHIQNKSSNPGASDNLVFRKRKRLPAVLIIFIVIITVSGILAHDEFYLFVIISSTLILIRKHINANYSIFFVSFLAAMVLVTLVDFLISPINYYTQREILGMPLIALGFLYVSASWALYLGLYLFRISNIYQHRINSIFNRLKAFVPKIASKMAFTRLKNFYDNQRTKVALRIVTASIVGYLYLFTLSVWAQVSDEDIRSHVKDEWNVPWYLYPVKFGMAGLLGLAFLVSYIFKKFEKEIFVFGMVALIAFLAGPYYDEHRFGKYIMTSMDAFAALLIYQIISSSISNLKLKLRPLITGLLLGSVIISSSLSVLMFAGYVELFTGVSGYIEGGRRDFPTPSEFQLLNFLRDKVYNSKTYNIAVPEKEVDYSTGFITKIYGFSALPRLKLLQSPLTLNASTLEGFYNLLYQSDTRYIVFPRKDFMDTQRQGSLVLSSSNNNIIQFALDNFPKVYQDSNYVVLEVLPVSPPSPSASNIALIYQRDTGELLSPLSNKTVNLPNNNETFKLETDGINKTEVIGDNIINRISKDDIKSSTNSTTIIASDDNDDSINNYKGTIFWTHPVHQIQQLHNNANTSSENNESKINYFEASFRIMDNNRIDKETGKKIKYDDYNAGILWLSQNKEYNLLITKDGLELLQTPITTEPSSKKYGQDLDNDDYSKQKKTLEMLPILLSQNQEIKREKGIWYNIKVLLLKNTINVYVNEVLKIKTPIISHSYSLSANKNATDHATAISKVGISIFHDQAEFQPILLGHMSEPTDQSYSKQKVYNRHFYPLTILALSNMKYETFLDNDLSAFSKRYVILPFDPSSDQVYDASRYLDYARSGGNLIVINSDNDIVQGMFAKLLSIRPGNPTNFNGIISALSHNSSKMIEKKYSITVSGVTQDIILPHPPNDMTVKSYYVSYNNDSKRIVAPFTIEKNYGKGKIIFVNAIGYFDTIFKNAISSNNDIGKEKNQFFMSLANVSNLIDLSGLQNNDYLKINSLPITSLPATRIIGDLEIAPGETGKINSSSILMPDSTSVNKYHSYDLSLKYLYISTLSNISGLNHKESNTITNLASINKEDLNPSPVSNYINNGTRNFQYKFQNVLIKDLKLYGGPFGVTIYSTNNSLPIHLPTSSSYYDYIGISIPAGFDIAIKLPNIKSSYVEFDLKGIADKKQTYQTVRIYGSDNGTNMSANGTYISNNEIYFRQVKADIQGIKSISVLMKHPEIRVLKDVRSHSKNEQVDAGNIAIRFKEDSHKRGPIEIRNTDGNIMAKVSYVDNYNRPYHSGIRTQFLTYLEQPIEIISENGNTSYPSKIYDSEKKIKIEMPGDISEYAKKHGIQIPWTRALSSDFNISLAVSIFVIMIIALWRILPRIREI